MTMWCLCVVCVCGVHNNPHSDVNNTPSFTGAKAEECACGQCVTKGWEGIKDLGLKFLKEIDDLPLWYRDEKGVLYKPSSSPVGGLKTRLLKSWDFLRTRLASHMSKDSEVVTHCLHWLLSSRSDKRLACQCAHPILSNEVPKEYSGPYDSTCSGSKCGGANGTVAGGKRLSSSFFACLYCSKISCRKCIRTMWGQSEQLGKAERSQRRFVCRSCSGLLAGKRHVMSCPECNEVQYLKKDLRYITSFVERSSHCDEISKKRVRIMVDRLCRNIDLYIGHVARDKNQNAFWPEKLQEWARNKVCDEVLILSDFWQLFAGTYERRVNCDTGDKQSVETHVMWSVCPPLSKLDANDLLYLTPGEYINMYMHD